MDKVTKLNISNRQDLPLGLLMENYSKPHLASQSGHLALTIITIIIPLLLLLFLIGIDLVGYFRAKQEVHSVLERELEILSRYANDRKEAEKLLLTRLPGELSRLNIEKISAQIIWKETTPPEADIKLAAQYKLLFSRSPILNNVVNEFSLPIKANATIQISPINAAVIVDSSNTTAPSSYTPGIDPSWFTNGLTTGASWFYSAPPLYLNNRPVPADYLSLRCFNSKLSAIKRAAITLIDLLQLFGAKEISLTFLSDRNTDFLRPSFAQNNRSLSQSYLSTTDPLVSLISSLKSVPSLKFSPYIAFFGRDSWCASAAIQEQLLPHLFSIPPISRLALNWGVRYGAATQVFIRSNPPDFSESYLASAPLREQIWFRAASEQDSSAAWQGMTRAADLLLGQLQPINRDLKAQISRKVIFVVTNKLPALNSQLLPEYISALATISQQLTLLNQRLNLLFLIINPDPKVLPDINWFISETNKRVDSARFRLGLELLTKESMDQETQIVRILSKSRRIVRSVER